MANKIINFGNKHKGKTFENVFTTDRVYATRLLTRSDAGGNAGEFKDYIRKRLSDDDKKSDKPPTDKKDESNNLPAPQKFSRQTLEDAKVAKRNKFSGVTKFVEKDIRSNIKFMNLISALNPELKYDGNVRLTVPAWIMEQKLNSLYGNFIEKLIARQIMINCGLKIKLQYMSSLLSSYYCNVLPGRWLSYLEYSESKNVYDKFLKQKLYLQITQCVSNYVSTTTSQIDDNLIQYMSLYLICSDLNNEYPLVKSMRSSDNFDQKVCDTYKNVIISLYDYLTLLKNHHVKKRKDDTLSIEEKDIILQNYKLYCSNRDTKSVINDVFGISLFVNCRRSHFKEQSIRGLLGDTKDKIYDKDYNTITRYVDRKFTKSNKFISLSFSVHGKDSLVNMLGEIDILHYDEIIDIKAHNDTIGSSARDFYQLILYAILYYSMMKNSDKQSKYFQTNVNRMAPKINKITIYNAIYDQEYSIDISNWNKENECLNAIGGYTINVNPPEYHEILENKNSVQEDDKSNRDQSSDDKFDSLKSEVSRLRDKLESIETRLDLLLTNCETNARACACSVM